MDVFQMFSVEADSVSSGVAIELGKNRKGAMQLIQIAPSNESNEAYQAALTRIYSRFNTEMTIGLSEAVRAQVEQASREAFAECCIRGWEGLLDPNGKDIVYSSAAAVRLLTDLPQLYAFLLGKSRDMSLFRKKVMEEEVKNSLPA